MERPLSAFANLLLVDNYDIKQITKLSLLYW